MPATVMNRDDEEVAFSALVTADGYLEDVKLIGDRIRRPAQSAHPRAAVGTAQRRRDRALRTRSRRRRSRLAECRLAGLAHDRARAPARLRPRARRRLEDALTYAVTKNEKRKTNSVTLYACRWRAYRDTRDSIRFSFFVFRYFEGTSPRAVAELFFAS